VSAASAWEIATKFRIGKLPGAQTAIDQFEMLLVANRIKGVSDNF
jgi:PIN domain nuclease of toxin-antitoxin system